MFLRIVLIAAAMFQLIILNDTYAHSVAADTLAQQDTTITKKDTSYTKNNSSDAIIAEDFGNRLKSQLNLTDEQTEKVKSIIVTYIQSYASGNNSHEPAGEQIEKVLNETQRLSWNTVTDGFWSDLNRRIKETKKG